MIGFGLLPAQQQPSGPLVRSISVRAVSTTSQGLASIEFSDIAAAWKRRQVNLAVEKRLDLVSIETAEGVIREMYRDSGHSVRVEHNVTQIPPRGVEVAFQVIELCRCN
jgi:hypothetical protein